MFSPSAYYLCSSGEVRKRANEYRATHNRLYSELFKIVHDMGAREACIEYTMMKLRGIIFPSGAPAGWTKPDRNGASRPMKTKQNADILKSFTPSGCYSITQHPELASFFEWLNCKCSYKYKTESGEGWSRIGNGFDPIGLFWFSLEGPILLKVPDMLAAKNAAKESNHILTDGELDWNPPKGCKKIIIEEWNLMKEKHRRSVAIASNLQISGPPHDDRKAGPGVAGSAAL